MEVSHIHDDDLILADGIAVADPDDCCAVEGCDEAPAVLVGPNEELMLCAGHAEELVLHLLRLPGEIGLSRSEEAQALLRRYGWLPAGGDRHAAQPP